MIYLPSFAGLTLFIRVIADSVTFTYEALAMTSVYFVYVGTVVGIHLYTKLIPRKTSSDDKLGLFHFMNTPDSTNSTSPAYRRDSADMLGIHSEHLKRNPLIDDALRDAGSTTMGLADVDINKVLDRDLEDAEREGTRLLELDEDEALHPDGELFGTATPLGTTMLNELHKELQPLDLEQVADGAWQIGAGKYRFHSKKPYSIFTSYVNFAFCVHFHCVFQLHCDVLSPLSFLL